MTGRADPFGDDDDHQQAPEPASNKGLDLSGFKPRKPVAAPKPEEIRKVAERASFPSREPVASAPAPQPSEPRLYRTGRNIQFSVKVTQELHDRIYAMTDELGARMARRALGMRWTVGLTVERMAAAL